MAAVEEQLRIIPEPVQLALVDDVVFENVEDGASLTRLGDAVLRRL